jgi:hypothetical protein
MAKDKNNAVQDAEVIEKPKTGEAPSVEETITILQTQVKDYAEKAEYFKNMLLKAQGALEVLTQIDGGDNNKGE